MSFTLSQADPRLDGSLSQLSKPEPKPVKKEEKTTLQKNSLQEGLKNLQEGLSRMGKAQPSLEFEKKSAAQTLREGLVIQYGKTPAQKIIMQHLVDYTTIVSHSYLDPDSGPERINYYLDVRGFHFALANTLRDPQHSRDTRLEMARFVSEGVLGDLLAPDKPMTVYWKGSIEERNNFYPDLLKEKKLPAVEKLRTWTQAAIKTIESEPVHTLNYWALGAEGAIVGSSLALTPLVWQNEDLRTVGMSVLGGGLGAMSANFFCAAAEIPNEWALCDLMGGLVGGIALGSLTGIVLNPLLPPPYASFGPPPIPEPNPDPDPVEPDHRNPTDAFGP